MSLGSQTAPGEGVATGSSTGDRRRRELIVRGVTAAGWLLLVGLILVPVFGGSRYLVYLGTLIAIHAALAVSLNLLLGYAGQFAISHAAFYGIGAYASALLVSDGGLSFWLSIPLAMLIAGVIATVIGYPAMRYTGGVHLALLTFAFGELARLIAANWHDVTGGPMGLRVLYLPEPVFGMNMGSSLGLYYLAVVMLLVTLLVTFVIRHSRFGRGLIAIREDEVLASFLGINITGYKLAAYVISSMLAAMVGTAYAPIMTFVSPELLSAHETITLVGVLILGGVGTMAGPIIGTLIFYGLPELLRIASFYRLVILGFVVIIVVLLMPKGIAGVINGRLERFRRGGSLLGLGKRR